MKSFYFFKTNVIPLFLLVVVNSVLCNAQSKVDKIDTKKILIESAQLADQSRFFIQSEYLNNRFNNGNYNIDSAIVYLNECVHFLDSAIVLTHDTDVFILKHSNLSKETAINSLRILFNTKNCSNHVQKKDMLNRALLFSENATIEAYHASLYIRNNVDKEKEVVGTDNIEKNVTKLDIDNQLFNLLKLDIFQKLVDIDVEILTLTQKISKTKEPSVALKLNNQLKTLELKKTNFEKKNDDVSQKLVIINEQLAQNNKNNSSKDIAKDTIFSNKIKKTDEWNKNFKSIDEMPDFLIYQIQLGVFKNSKLPETFKGLTPIFCLKNSEGNSYSIGLFDKLKDATEAKKNVKAMGLTDAFIVAYFKQKKITIAEAQKIEKK